MGAYGKEISELDAKGRFTVALSSSGNPDRFQDPEAELPGVPSMTVRVGSLKEAREACRAYIDEFELGGGNWSGGDVVEDGRLVARVSYNGRVWEIPENDKTPANGWRSRRRAEQDQGPSI